MDFKEIFSTPDKKLSLEEQVLFAKKIRGMLVEISSLTKTPHLGSSLSCVDVVTALYSGILNLSTDDPWNENRDRFILSKGHAATTLYAVLANRGFIPLEILNTFNTNGSELSEHPGPKCQPGIEVATGSLGHGLGLGLGMALAGRLQKRDYNVYVVLSDGECNEGSVWEAAMFGAANNLNNVIAIVDFNRWQATGRSEEVLALSPLKDKWQAFGWNSFEIDGHSIEEINKTILEAKKNSNKPTAIIANTVKGKGVSFMEDDNNWHYRIPTEEEVIKAKEELGL